MKSDNLDASVRQELLYDPATGHLWWKRPRRGRKMHKPAGCKANGYVRVNLGGRFLYAHRVAWFLHTGSWPEGHIDHKNGVRGDNRIKNLRVVDRQANSQNQRRPQKNNRSGFLGVSPKGGRWRAHITLGGKRVYLGGFSTPQDAHEAYVRAKRKWHKGNTL